MNLDHDMTELFGNECITPSQHADMRTSNQLSGEARLMLAVLTDALECARGYVTLEGGSPRPRAQRRRQLEAQDWINGDSSPFAFSFENICQFLGFDAATVRARSNAGLIERVGRVSGRNAKSQSHLTVLRQRRAA